MYLTEGMTFTQRVTWEEEIASTEGSEGTEEGEASPPVKVRRVEDRTYEVIAASGEIATEPGIEFVRVKVVARHAVE